MDKKVLKNVHVNKPMLADLLNKPEDFHVVADRFEHIIWKSFEVLDAQLNPGQEIVPTETELKRRFEICLNWFKTMRLDLGWGQERSLDTLSWVLANVLLDIPFTLEELGEFGWSPETLTPDAVLGNS